MLVRCLVSTGHKDRNHDERASTMNMSRHTFQPDNKEPKNCALCGRREKVHMRARMNSDSTRREHFGGRVLRRAS